MRNLWGISPKLYPGPPESKPQRTAIHVHTPAHTPMRLMQSCSLSRSPQLNFKWPTTQAWPRLMVWWPHQTPSMTWIPFKNQSHPPAKDPRSGTTLESPYLRSPASDTKSALQHPLNNAHWNISMWAQCTQNSEFTNLSNTTLCPPCWFCRHDTWVSRLAKQLFP
jgi:hypothetical protein